VAPTTDTKATFRYAAATFLAHTNPSKTTLDFGLSMVSEIKKILDSMRYSRGIAYLQSATQIAIAPLPPCNLVAKLAPSCDRKKNYTKRNHFVVNVDKLTVLFTGLH
jgi:hypothetical protein